MSHKQSLTVALVAMALLAGCRTPVATKPVTGNNVLGNNTLTTGGSIIAPGAGNIIASGGGNVIAPGGANAIQSGGLEATGKTSAPATALPTASFTAAADFVPDSIGMALPGSLTAKSYRVADAAVSVSAFLKGSIAVYFATTEMVDGILKAVKKNKLEFDKPITFKADDGGELTIVVRKSGTAGLVSIYRGDKATASSQLIGIRYTPSTQAGTAVFRPDVDREGLKAATIVFNTPAATAKVDALSDTRAVEAALDKQLGRAHWEFDGKPEGKRAFKLQVAATVNKAAGDSGSFALTAHYLKDGSAAAIFGFQSPALPAFVWMPNDGDFTHAASAHDFYMSATGADMAPGDASEELKAILPADNDINRPFPAMPQSADPSGEAIFEFPQ